MRRAHQRALSCTHHFGGLAVKSKKEQQNDLENSIQTAQISVAGTNNDGERQKKDEFEIINDTEQLEFPTVGAGGNGSKHYGEQQMEDQSDVIDDEEQLHCSTVGAGGSGKYITVHD